LAPLPPPLVEVPSPPPELPHPVATSARAATSPATTVTPLILLGKIISKVSSLVETRAVDTRVAPQGNNVV
jgi:hypothetical protein